MNCSLDAWSILTSDGPAARQDHSMVWDPATQSALVFGGQAASVFQYFNDLWRYSWPLRSWMQISASGPGPRYGHSAVWDPQSRAMLVMGGKHLSDAFKELWLFSSDLEIWELLSAESEPPARAYHSAIWDETARVMIIFGGENAEVLSDLHMYSVVGNKWTMSDASGPGARARHTAVWDGVTRWMLIFGGWSGDRYLSDLWRYDRWSGRWAELSAAGPLPRAGHGASWDPVSLSLLIFGGVQNTSGALSYDSGLYNYSLLAGWTELRPDPQLQSPSSRSDMLMVWDATSKGLLVFGGYNSSYLSETWRYVVSSTVAPPIVRCYLGQPCLLHLGSSSSTLAVKDACLSDTQPAADVDAQQVLHAEPGTYHICQCPSQPCDQMADFNQVAGFFIAEGPFSNQSAECFLGSSCKIHSWIGVGISADDHLVLRKSCHSTDTSAYSGVAILVEFDLVTYTFTLDLGHLAVDHPEDVELCWCPSSIACTSTEDFIVVALRLQILCPPGQHQSDAGCLPCPADHYCTGGSAKHKCPVGSTALVGSGQLLRLAKSHHSRDLCMCTL